MTDKFNGLSTGDLNKENIDWAIACQEEMIVHLSSRYREIVMAINQAQESSTKLRRKVLPILQPKSKELKLIIKSYQRGLVVLMDVKTQPLFKAMSADGSCNIHADTVGDKNKPWIKQFVYFANIDNGFKFYCDREIAIPFIFKYVHNIEP